MTLIPQYQDVITAIDMKKQLLPFYINIHHVVSPTMLHHHDFVELTFVFEGSGVEVINGKKYKLKPGSASFLLPHHMHEVTSDPGTTVRKYCLMFDIHLLFGSSYDAELSNLLFRIGSTLPSYAFFEPEEAKEMHRLLDNLYAENNKPQELGHKSMIRSKLTEVMLRFVRCCARTAPTENILQPDNGKQRFWSILQYVHVHYPQKLTLDSLSEKFRISVPYISRAFKEHMGISFLEYLHRLRINSAASMLLSTDMTIADISMEVGFESFRSFSRVFREVRNQTPSEYRKANKPAVFG